MKRTELRRSNGNARASVPVPKTKRCKLCKEPFVAMRPLQVACSGPCAELVAIAKRLKAERREDAEKRAKLKPRSQWLREAQSAFNRFIRLRDANRGCISCGRFHEGQWHAGHYLSTGARPELRFDERNVHRQCQPCNTHLHGNLVLYRAELISRVGMDVVVGLEGPHAPRHYGIDDLKEIIATYRAKAKELSA